MTREPRAAGGRRIERAERSGVLHPGNLLRYDAGWFTPDPDVAAVVDQYWHVSWDLPAQEGIDQRIIDLPAVTLTVETGDVPAPLLVTGLQSRAWNRHISGTGEVFAIRLRPAGLAVLSELTPHQVADRAVPVTAALDGPLFAFLEQVRAAPDPASRARTCDELIRARLRHRPPGPDLLLANDILSELMSRVRSRTGTSLSARFGVSDRTVQRALRSGLGRGPKWVSRRIRLQEVARLLATTPTPDLASLAVRLGYTDQAHLTGDFRSVAGLTPGTYLAQLRALSERVDRS